MLLSVWGWVRAGPQSPEAQTLTHTLPVCLCLHLGHLQLMCELDDLCEDFKYLGSYTEVV